MGRHPLPDDPRTVEILAKRRLGYTYEAIGAGFDLSKERVRQIIKRHAPELCRMSQDMVAAMNEEARRGG